MTIAQPFTLNTAMSITDIKSMILASGLPRERFCEKIGISNSAFQRILDGRDPITSQLRIRLLNLFGPSPAPSHPTRDEWIQGEGPPPRRREYIVHTHFPRFVARVVALDEITDEPKPEEQPADITTGVVYTYGPSHVCEIDWIDPSPKDPAQMLRLLEAIAEQLDWDA